MVYLSDHQIEAVERMHNGCILCGMVGSGKSRAAIAYYYLKVCNGRLPITNFETNKLYDKYSKFQKMSNPIDLYIITTAKKRDSLDWIKECAPFVLTDDRNTSISGIKVIIDSWNNVVKYKKVYGAFFIFDEQRVVGSGPWVKAFIDITRKNKWILLSATPGDKWLDYCPVFIANGFYRNKTEFINRHCVYSRYSKYKIDRYMDEPVLEYYKKKILIEMPDERNTVRHEIVTTVKYDKDLFRTIFVDRWDPYDNKPIMNSTKLYYLMRKAINTDPSRVEAVLNILNVCKKAIIFYNFDYELEILENMCIDNNIPYSQWNGHKHQELLDGDTWLYLVQYSSGCEGWNCIETNTIIFYSQNYSYRTVEQAKGRIDRMNTPYTDLYYYWLRCGAWIDLAIYRAYKNKKKFNEKNLFQNDKNR